MPWDLVTVRQQFWRVYCFAIVRHALPSKVTTSGFLTRQRPQKEPLYLFLSASHAVTVGEGVGDEGVGNNVGDGTGNGVVDGVGDDVGDAVGVGVGDNVGEDEGEDVGEDVGERVGHGPRVASLTWFTSAVLGVLDAALQVPTTWRATSLPRTTTAQRSTAPVHSSTHEQPRRDAPVAQPRAVVHDVIRTAAGAERF